MRQEEVELSKKEMHGIIDGGSDDDQRILVCLSVLQSSSVHSVRVGTADGGEGRR